MSYCGQEMTLRKYVEQLPESHLARKQYDLLIEDADYLNRLRDAGVDRIWEGYSS